MTNRILFDVAARHGIVGPDPSAARIITATEHGRLDGGEGSDLLVGGPGIDRIFGNGGVDLIAGKGGDDILRGGDGTDVILGDGGNDRIYGEGDDDVILGGSGDDELSGGAGNDIVRGGAGEDRIHGGAGDDNLSGGTGSDVVRGGAGNDRVAGGAGDDRLFGQGGNDTVLGGAGDDLLAGGAGDDVLNGGAGRDVLIGGRGADVLIGGGGADLFRFNPARTAEGDDVVRDFALGEDKIVLDVADVLASTPDLAAAIVAGGGDVAAVLQALDDSPLWRLEANGAGDLVVAHPNGTITLKGIPAAGITSFADVAPALSVEGLGETLASLAGTTGQPATIADVVAPSGGTPDDNGGDFDLLLTALNATGLTGVLADPAGSFSVFAPNDDAFVSLAQRLGFAGDDEAGALAAILDTATALGGGDPVPVLTDILTYHVVGGAKTLGELQADRAIQPLFTGADLELVGNEFDDADPDLGNAEVIASDIITGNGVIQVINEVLLPFDV